MYCTFPGLTPLPYFLPCWPLASTGCSIFIITMDKKHKLVWVRQSPGTDKDERTYLLSSSPLQCVCVCIYIYLKIVTVCSNSDTISLHIHTHTHIRLCRSWTVVVNIYLLTGTGTLSILYPSSIHVYTRFLITYMYLKRGLHWDVVPRSV